MYRRNKKIWVILLVFCVIILGGCRRQEEEVMIFEEVELEEKSEEIESDEIEESVKMVVHVCGQVIHPGVYELNESSRIYEAVSMAGGMTEAAAKDYVNQAEFLKDGQKIYIPSVEEIQQGEIKQNSIASHTDQGEKKVNINTADKKTLQQLPGIGALIAQRILDYRDAYGGFDTIGELINVDGIGEKTLEKIWDYVSIGG
jgi:competence protein ComEA